MIMLSLVFDTAFTLSGLQVPLSKRITSENEVMACLNAMPSPATIKARLKHEAISPGDYYLPCAEQMTDRKEIIQCVRLLLGVNEAILRKVSYNLSIPQMEHSPGFLQIVSEIDSDKRLQLSAREYFGRTSTSIYPVSKRVAVMRWRDLRDKLWTLFCLIYSVPSEMTNNVWIKKNDKMLLDVSKWEGWRRNGLTVDPLTWFRTAYDFPRRQLSPVDVAIIGDD